mmetsp:Transcript_54597/g.168125  ORF Transcript_54597/g.168125 Transcript_54597/m.168125 type:complete len:274 (-) Transcript_54597:1889-2710(-)
MIDAPPRARDALASPGVCALRGVGQRHVLTLVRSPGDGGRAGIRLARCRGGVGFRGALLATRLLFRPALLFRRRRFARGRFLRLDVSRHQQFGQRLAVGVVRGVVGATKPTFVVFLERFPDNTQMVAVRDARLHDVVVGERGRLDDVPFGGGVDDDQRMTLPLDAMERAREAEHHLDVPEHDGAGLTLFSRLARGVQAELGDLHVHGVLANLHDGTLGWVREHLLGESRFACFLLRLLDDLEALGLVFFVERKPDEVPHCAVGESKARAHVGD